VNARVFRKGSNLPNLLFRSPYYNNPGHGTNKLAHVTQ